MINRMKTVAGHISIMPRAILALILGGSLLLPGCGGAAPEADLTFVSGSEHNHLDPVKMSWSHDIRIAHALYDTLVRFDFGSFEVLPATADQWEVSDDGLTYTFHIREDAKWSNGDPVTANDYLYAWRRGMLPDLAADYTQLFYPIRGAKAFYAWRTEQLAEYARIASAGGGGSQDAAASMWELAQDRFEQAVGVSAPDERTIVVELERPVPYFLELVAFSVYMPVHAASVEQATSLNASTGMIVTDTTYWSDPVTNGPYVIADRKFQRYLAMKANPHYWNRAAMRNDSVTELIITDPITAVTTYNAGGATFLPDIPSAGPLAADLVAEGGPDVHTQTMAGTYFYNFNCLPTLRNGQPNPLADARVRRALAMAIDRETIVTKVTKLNQPIARTYTPPGVIAGYDPPAEAGITFDSDTARALLADAGYPGGEGLDGLSILYNTGHYHELIAQAIKNMWQEELGVTVTLEGVDGKAFSTRLKQQEYTIARASWFGDYPDPTTFLDKMTTTDGNNDCKWSNAEFDALLAEAATITDPGKRMATLRDAEAILLEDAPMALIFQYVEVYLYPETLEGLRPNAWKRWRLEDIHVVGD